MKSHPDPEVTHAYLGFFRCGHMNWMGVDERDPEEADSLASDVAEIIRGNGWVTRVTLEEARATQFGCPDDCPLSWKNNIESAKKK